MVMKTGPRLIIWLLPKYIIFKEGEGQGPPECLQSRQKKAIGMISPR